MKESHRNSVRPAARRLWIAGLVLALCLTALGGPAGGAGQGLDTLAIPDAGLLEVLWATDGVTAAHPKLASSLNALLAAAEEGGAAGARDYAGARQMASDGQGVQVVLVAAPAGEGAVLEAVGALGGQVQARYQALVQAWLPLEALRPLADREEVLRIREPLRPVALPPAAAEAAGSEGVAASNAGAWHAAGYLGSGARIAVLDVGFDGYQALLGSELPAGVTPYDWSGEGLGGTGHGTACAEIVHDMAPAAALDLHKVTTDVELGNAVTQALADGVDAISMSLSWILGGPGDGTGPLANLVAQARAGGILFAVGAGNLAEASWTGAYHNYQAGSDNLHAWDGVNRWFNFMGPGDGRCYVYPAGTPLVASLHWDDWPLPTQDYDLHLVRWPGSGSTLYEVAHSGEPQTGQAGQTPEELIAFPASGSDCYAWVVRRVQSDRNVCLRLLAPTAGHLDQWTPVSSLAFPADAPAALAVGAVDVNPPHDLEPYSSQGPTLGAGGACSGGSVRPDLVAYDRVSTATFGPAGFAGDSPAVPHVAGAAALVLQAFPTYGVDELQEYLEQQAVDLGAAGKDNLSGWGRLYLGDPPLAGKAWTGALGAAWHQAGNWSPPGVPTATDDVTIPATAHDPVLSTADAAVHSLRIQPGAALDLGEHTLTVEGLLTNQGTLRQRREVGPGETAPFLRIQNQGGTQTAYYGLDLMPFPSTAAAAGAAPAVADLWPGPDPEGLPAPLGSEADAGPAAGPEGWQAMEAPREPAAPAGEAAVAGQQTLYAVADATVIEAAPTTNFGSTGDMWVGYDNCLSPIGKTARSLVRFDLSALPPGVTISQATLRIYQVNTCDIGQRTHTVTAYRPAGAWSEAGVTWNNKPGYAESYGSASITSGVWNWSSLNVTNLVRGWVAGTTANHGILLRGPESSSSSGARLGFSTREGAQRPQLVVQYEATNTPPTLASLPDQQLPFNSSKDKAIDLWAYASDAEDPDSALTFTIANSPAPEAGVRIDANRYVDIYPNPGWFGETYVQIRVRDRGGLTADSTFRVTVLPGPMDVTVAISGDQGCAGRPSGVRRCYDIAADGPLFGTVRFYFREAERSSLALDKLAAFHYEGHWRLEPGPYSRGGAGEALYVEVRNVDDFSPFALDERPGGGPTTVVLPLVLRRYSPSLLFFDDFSNPASGWDSVENESARIGYLNGEYQILLKKTSTGAGITPDLVLPANYSLSVQARELTGRTSSYGLMFDLRVVGSSFEVHQFLIDPRGRQFLLERRDLAGNWTVLIDWTYHSAIQGGTASNLLAVERVGSTLRFWVNDTLVRTYTDTGFASAGRDGGLRAYSYDQAPVDVRFDNFAAWHR
jgi:hypothetical protein